MRVLSGFLTFVLCVGLPVAGLLAVTAIAGTPAYTGAVVLGLVMTAYGIVAAWLGTYDLTTGKGWLMLLVDLTWSLPNTVFAVVIRKDGEAVGMGRVVGDGGLFFQVVDIAVLPEHHGVDWARPSWGRWSITCAPRRRRAPMSA